MCQFANPESALKRGLSRYNAGVQSYLFRHFSKFSVLFSSTVSGNNELCGENRTQSTTLLSSIIFMESLWFKIFTLSLVKKVILTINVTLDHVIFMSKYLQKSLCFAFEITITKKVVVFSCEKGDFVLKY